MRNRLFPSIARQISIACLIAMLYEVVLLINGNPSADVPVIFLLYSVIICLINHFFAKKPRQVHAIVVLNALCCGAVLALCFVSFGLSLVWQIVFGVLAVVLITAIGVHAVYGSLKMNSILLIMDANILLLIFAILVIQSREASYGWIFFAVLGVFFGLLGTISFRIARPAAGREWGLIVFLFACIAVLAWLLFSFVVSPLSTGAVGLGQGIAAAFIFIERQIERFFAFLATLWKDDGSAEPIELEPQPGMSTEAVEGDMGDYSFLPVIVIVLLIAAVVFLLIRILKRTGKHRVKARNAARTYLPGEDHGIRLTDAFRRVIERIKRRIRAVRYLAAYKNSPEGIYFTLKKVCRHTELAEQSGDTPAGFLERIRDGCSGKVCTAHMDDVICLLNRNFYSDRPEYTVFPWAKDLLKEIKAQRRKIKASRGKSAAQENMSE